MFKESADRSVPRWLRVVVGAFAVVAGALLTLKPFDSLAALALLAGLALIVAGGADLVDSATRTDAAMQRVGAAALLVAGLAALIFPSLTVRSLALVAGLGLIARGVVTLIAGPKDDAVDRIASVLIGLAGITIGFLALAWPDLTLLVIALLVGPALVLVGLLQFWHALRGDERDRGESRQRPRRAGHLVFALIAIVLAGALVAVSVFLDEGKTELDAFYTPPTQLPQTAGALIRSEAFTTDIPRGATAKRILYTTTDINGRVIPASAIVVVPSRRVRPRVILWNHGTTGIVRECAPSASSAPFTSGALFVLPQVVEHGWALVAPDYPGLGAPGKHPYLVGRPTAYSGLDAVRAARKLGAFKLGGQTIAWGHSQGGGAALWEGVVAKRYAPDVPLLGVAALAPASDVYTLAGALQNSSIGMLFGSFVISGYADTYPDVSFGHYVRPGASETVRAAAGRCLLQKSLIASAASMAAGDSVYSRPFTDPPLGTRLKENVPSEKTGIPTLLAQGLADQLVLPRMQAGFVATLCANGQQVDYQRYPGLNHVPLVQKGSPAIKRLFSWTSARFAGLPARGNCRRVKARNASTNHPRSE